MKMLAETAKKKSRTNNFYKFSLGVPNINTVKN